MREPISVDDWSLIRFQKQNESCFFVVIGLDQNSSGICSNRIVVLKGHNVPDGLYEDAGNIVPFQLRRFHCRDDRGVKYRLLKKAPKGENPWAALFSLLKWCGNEFKPGDFRHASIFELQEALRNRPTFDAWDDARLPTLDTAQLQGVDVRDVYRPKDIEALHDFVEIPPAKERQMGPCEVTCLECGWVSFALSRVEAEREIARFNRYFDRLSKEDQESLYGGRRSSLASYRCIHCGNGDENRFRPARHEDCPDGVTLNPVVCDRLAKRDED